MEIAFTPKTSREPGGPDAGSRRGQLRLSFPRFVGQNDGRTEGRQADGQTDGRTGDVHIRSAKRKDATKIR